MRSEHPFVYGRIGDKLTLIPHPKPPSADTLHAGLPPRPVFINATIFRTTKRNRVNTKGRQHHTRSANKLNSIGLFQKVSPLLPLFHHVPILRGRPPIANCWIRRKSTEPPRVLFLGHHTGSNFHAVYASMTKDCRALEIPMDQGFSSGMALQYPGMVGRHPPRNSAGLPSCSTIPDDFSLPKLETV